MGQTCNNTIPMPKDDQDSQKDDVGSDVITQTRTLTTGSICMHCLNVLTCIEVSFRIYMYALCHGVW